MSDGPSGGPPADPTYSRAFERLAGDEPDDVVNPLAYALYKKGVWEAARSGGSLPPRAQRDLPPSQVEIHRDAARLRLQSFAAAAIAQAAPTIEQTGVTKAIDAAKTEIVGRIAQRTHWLGSFLVNLLAWIVSILLTWLIVQSVTLPSVVDALSRAVRAEQAGQPLGGTVPPR